MDARTIWDTWRHILRDDDLVGIVTRPGASPPVTIGGLNDTQTAIVAEYGRTPVATDTNVGMYRRGLVRLARVALGRVPLTQRLLLTRPGDEEEVLEDFVRCHGYADDGPNFWRLAEAVVSHLESRPYLSDGRHQEVLALDLALTRLNQQLGASPPDVWPDDAVKRHGVSQMDTGPLSTRRFVSSQAAVVARSTWDLTPWIEDPYGFDPEQALAQAPKQWLLYLPSAESAPAYADISERSARVLEALRTPLTLAEVSHALGDLSEAEVGKVIEHLAALGVVATEGGTAHEALSDAAETPFGDELFVMLDPAVELLPGTFDEHHLLCHGHLGVGMAIPPGEGLLDFIQALGKGPIRIGALRRGYDDQQLVDVMLCTLSRHGFLHFSGAMMPDVDALSDLRAAAQDVRAQSLSHSLHFQLEVATAEAILERVAIESVPPELHLHGGTPGSHAVLLRHLAVSREKGRLKVHRVFIHFAELNGVGDVISSLRLLGAEVVIAGVAWPAPSATVPGLQVLVSGCIPVYAAMSPDRSLLNDDVCRRAVEWGIAVSITGLALTLEPERIWPGANPGPSEFITAFEAIRRMEARLGDISIANMPGDEVLLGNAAAPERPLRSAIEEAFRLTYLRWRLPLLKLSEGDNTFSQTPEAEEKLVRQAEDLLPNHPELLRMGAGSMVVDVCGGNGRVARRLSPVVGPEGLVVSIEMLRSVTDRARRFATEHGFTNIQFRTALAESLPLPDGVADAVVNEWTGAIWQLGLGDAMLSEMARVVKKGGRVAVTHRLVRLPLLQLDRPWVQFDDIYALMQRAFQRSGLKIVSERIWGQTVQSLAGERATSWRKLYLPRLVNPFEVTYTEDRDPGPHADVCLTIIAERVQ